MPAPVSSALVASWTGVRAALVLALDLRICHLDGVPVIKQSRLTLLLPDFVQVTLLLRRPVAHWFQATHELEQSTNERRSHSCVKF